MPPPPRASDIGDVTHPLLPAFHHVQLHGEEPDERGPVALYLKVLLKKKTRATSEETSTSVMCRLSPERNLVHLHLDTTCPFARHLLRHWYHHHHHHHQPHASALLTPVIPHTTRFAPP